MKNECEKFISLLGKRKGAAKINLRTFDQNEWFRGAYSTVQRTRRGCSSFADAERKTIIKLLFDACSEICVHPSEIESKISCLKENCPGQLTLGQVQKLLNILLKYHVCYFFAGQDDVWNKAHDNIAESWASFHVPIDSIVLLRLCEVAPDVVCGRIYANKIFQFNKKANKCEWSQTAKVFSNDRKINPKASGQPWSKLDDMEAYMWLQNTIKALAKKENMSPLEYEMKVLWA